jgi:hypothetical protein
VRRNTQAKIPNSKTGAVDSSMAGLIDESSAEFLNLRCGQVRDQGLPNIEKRRWEWIVPFDSDSPDILHQDFDHHNYWN